MAQRVGPNCGPFFTAPLPKCVSVRTRVLLYVLI
jgi:hypothetical protein